MGLLSQAEAGHAWPNLITSSIPTLGEQKGSSKDGNNLCRRLCQQPCFFFCGFVCIRVCKFHHPSHLVPSANLKALDQERWYCTVMLKSKRGQKPWVKSCHPYTGKLPLLLQQSQRELCMSRGGFIPMFVSYSHLNQPYLPLLKRILIWLNQLFKLCMLKSLIRFVSHTIIQLKILFAEYFECLDIWTVLIIS